MKAFSRSLGSSLLFVGLTTAAFAADTAWISLAAMPDPRQEVGVAELGGKIYVIGGLPRTDTVQQYDPATNSWKVVAPIPIPGGVDHAAAASVAGKLYVMGGNTDSGSTNEVFEYDPARDQWTRKAPMSTARSAPAAAVINGKIYAVGGTSATQRELEVYDPAADTWVSRAPMPTGRNHLAASAIQGKLYVAGGRNGTSFTLSVLEVYNPATDAWTTKAPMLTGRSGHAGAALQDKFYTFGGEGNLDNPAGVFPQVEVYDPDADVWKSLDPMFTPRHGIGAAPLGNRIYVPGGATRAGGGFQVGVNQALVFLTETIYFAHFAVGAGLGSQIIVANPGATASAATIEFRDQSGNPLVINLAGVASSKVSLGVAGAGSNTITITDSGPARLGTATVSSDTKLSGLIFFADSVSGIGTSSPAARFFFPVQRDLRTGVNTGIAIENTTDGPVTVNMELTGLDLKESVRRQVTLGPRGQIAEPLERLFPGTSFGSQFFWGTVTGTSTGGVAVLGLLFKGNNFTAVPVSGL